MGSISEHFSWAEFTSGDGKSVPTKLRPNTRRLVQWLEVIRAAAGGLPIDIHSGYRSLEHNEAIGGATNSQHMRAAAADFSIAGWSTSATYCLLEKLIQEGKIEDGGLGVYPAHVHYDIRGSHSRWNEDIVVPDCSQFTFPTQPTQEEEHMPTEEFNALDRRLKAAEARMKAFDKGIAQIAGGINDKVDELKTQVKAFDDGVARIVGGLNDKVTSLEVQVDGTRRGTAIALTSLSKSVAELFSLIKTHFGTHNTGGSIIERTGAAELPNVERTIETASRDVTRAMKGTGENSDGK